MNVAVIGASGQLGRDVSAACESRGDLVHSLSHEDIEISNVDSVFKVVRDLRPQLIVNTAAMHHVEKCEQAAAAAFAINALGARNLAIAARETGAALLHISTDYVFDGNKTTPYTETDLPGPLNVYGNTKLAGELFVRAELKQHFIVRTSAIYGKSPCRAKGGLNFVELMLKLAKERGEVRVVDSEFVSPTFTHELAQQIVDLGHGDHFGLYHATAEGSCSWYEFAREIFALTKTPVKLNAAAPNEFPAKVPRPLYSVLENAGLKKIGLNRFQPWAEGLRKYLYQNQGMTAGVA